MPRGRRIVAAAATSAAAVAVGLVGAGAGHADPPPSLSTVQARVHALDDRLDRAVEDYDQARLDLAAARHRAADAERHLTEARQRLDRLRVQVSAVAAAAYRGASGGGGLLDSLMVASDPQQFVDRTAALDEIGRDQAATLQAFTAAEHDLTERQQAADQQLAEARRLAARLADRKQFIERSLAEQKALLGRLRAEQRARLAARQRAEARRQAALRASALGGAAAVPSYHGTASGQASVAVRWAYQELGKPYSWGAAGPSAFDCSGLTMYVWARAGVSLPHSSAAQYGSGPHVSRADLQPGDLVFFGSPIHHVGIYVGGGNMIEAPHTGTVVRVAGVDRPDYVGAVRP